MLQDIFIFEIEGKSASEGERISSNDSDEISNLRWTISLYAEES